MPASRKHDERHARISYMTFNIPSLPTVNVKLSLDLDITRRDGGSKPAQHHRSSVAFVAQPRLDSRPGFRAQRLVITFWWLLLRLAHGTRNSNYGRLDELMSANVELHSQGQNGTVDEEKLLTQSPASIDARLNGSPSESDGDAEAGSSEEEFEQEHSNAAGGDQPRVVQHASDDEDLEESSEGDDAEYDEDDDDEDEDEEPALKYERLGGPIHDLLQRDSASALAISNKLLVRVLCVYR